MTLDRLRPFRMLGVLTSLIGVGEIVVWAANMETRRNGGRDLSWLIWLGLVTLLIAISVIRLNRWSIMFCSFCYALLGCWLILGSFWHVPFPWLLLNVVLGFCCLLPLIYFIRIIFQRPG